MTPSGATLGSFAAFAGHLIAAQTQLINSYLGIGSSLARRSRPATPTAPHSDPAPAPEPAPAAEAIAARAYEIFVRRGRGPGDPVDDWRRAEAELRAGMTG
jgi:hypothetical protein